jgi:importin-7
VLIVLTDAQFLTTLSIKPKSTWQLLKPHVDSIVQNLAFPIFCFNEEDAETFEDDPIEFIRSQLDIIEEANLLAGRAGIFVESLVTKRKATFMPQLASLAPGPHRRRKERCTSQMPWSR